MRRDDNGSGNYLPYAYTTYIIILTILVIGVLVERSFLN